MIRIILSGILAFVIFHFGSTLFASFITWDLHYFYISNWDNFGRLLYSIGGFIVVVIATATQWQNINKVNTGKE